MLGCRAVHVSRLGSRVKSGIIQNIAGQLDAATRAVVGQRCFSVLAVFGRQDCNGSRARSTKSTLGASIWVKLLQVRHM